MLNTATTEYQNPTGKRLLFGALIGLFVLALAVTLYSYTRTPLRVDPADSASDLGLFAEMARLEATGHVLYVDLWDNKPPGMFVILSVFVRLFGNTVEAMSAGTLAMNVFFAVAAMALAYAVSRSVVGTLAGGVWALLCSGAQRQPETTFIMAGIGALAMTLALLGRGRRWWMIAAGFVFALGVMTKQPLLFELPILLLLAAIRAPGTRRDQVKAAALALVGVAIGGAAIALWAISNGSAQSMWYHLFGSISQYVFATNGKWHFNSDSLSLFQDYFVDGTLPRMSALFILAGAAAAILIWKRRRDPLVWTLLAWIIVTFVAASTARALKADYYRQMYPALLATVALAAPVAQRLSLRWQVPLLALTVVCSVYFGNRTVWMPSLDARRDGDLAVLMPVVDYVEQHTAPGECLWLWGGINQVSYFSGHGSCTGAAYDGHMMDSSAFPIEVNRVEYMHNLFDHLPRLHVWMSAWGYFPELQNFADRYLGPQVFTSEKYRVYTVDASRFHRMSGIDFGGEIGLFGYDLPARDAYCPGDALALALTWQQESRPTHEYQMFAQLITSDETAQIAQFTGVPALDRPTYEWADRNELVLGPTFDLTISPEAAPGTYKLVVGLFDVEAPDEHLRVLGADGQPSGGYAHLQDVVVKEGC